MTSNIIWAVAEFIDKVCEDVDFSSHPLILEVFFGAWKRFLGVDLHRSGQDILRIGSQLSSLTYKLLLRSLLRKTTHDIVSRMGGPSIIVAYFLAFIEDFTQQMKSINTRPAYGDLLLQQTLFNLVHLLQFSSFRDGVALKIAIRKITAVLKWLIEDLERLPPAQRPRLPSTNDSSMHKVRLSGVIRVYYDLIGQCPWSETYYPAMDVFRLGILEKLRSSLHEDIFSADLWDEEHLFTFDAFISSLGQEASTFPRMRRHMQSILHLPSNQHHQSIWRRFDEMFELTVNTHAEAERLVDCYFGLCARPSCKQSPEHGVKLKLCSACRVSHYCSVECQKIDWTQGNHRSLCLLFQLSGSTHPLIRTNDATGIAYLASLENVWRDVNHYHSRAQTALSTHRLQFPSTDGSTSTSGLFVIQITMFEDSPATNFKVKDLVDFPHLFGTESWFTVIEPRLRTFMAKKNLPEYLCVFSLPLIGSHLDLLSPLQVITISGKLSEKVKHANGE
ncbi:hypothetical protein ONZ45_g11510 [Pleurotus djamor]|nr:hypothetical protein ONZ45_g11510 [Pleurotus djamor]